MAREEIMNVHLGPIPDNPDFRPQDGRWQSLKEPSPWVAQLCAFPLAVAVFLGLMVAWRIVIPSGFFVEKVQQAMFLILPALLVAIPVHEAIHGMCHPYGGRSEATVFGFWPRKLLFYAHYDDEMSRNRFLLVLTAPFVVLTLGPLLISAAFSWIQPFLISLSFANGVAASLDILGFALIGVQLPSSARLRNKGYRTWWRDATAPFPTPFGG